LAGAAGDSMAPAFHIGAAKPAPRPWWRDLRPVQATACVLHVFSPWVHVIAFSSY